MVSGSSFYVFAIGGVTGAEEVDLARSNVTGWNYENNSETHLYGLYEAGIGYYLRAGAWPWH